MRYERFQKNQPQPQAVIKETNNIMSKSSRKEAEKPLIDFGDDGQATSSQSNQKGFLIKKMLITKLLRYCLFQSVVQTEQRNTQCRKFFNFFSIFYNNSKLIFKISVHR